MIPHLSYSSVIPSKLFPKNITSHSAKNFSVNYSLFSGKSCSMFIQHISKLKMVKWYWLKNWNYIVAPLILPTKGKLSPIHRNGCDLKVFHLQYASFRKLKITLKNRQISGHSVEWISWSQIKLSLQPHIVWLHSNHLTCRPEIKIVFSVFYTIGI